MTCAHAPQRFTMTLAFLFFVLCSVAFALLEDAIWPEAGNQHISDGSLTVDMTHADQGYILACGPTTSSRLKLRISQGDTTYTYDLNGSGEYEVFPLQMGSGSYGVSLYQNAKANKYSKKGEVSLRVQLKREDAAFLGPSQYVNYEKSSPAVAKAQELCANLDSDADKLAAVRSFMVGGFAYDFPRSLTQTGYLADIDGCFNSRLGLCQDFAAVFACMLRSQGVPVQLVIGTANNNYHAWNNVLINGKSEFIDVTAELNGFRSDTVYVPERYY